MNPLEAYKILQNRQMSEDRILAERTSMFLLATAFLFLAFVALLDPDLTTYPIIEPLRIILPILGIILSFLIFCFNKSASIALDFWHKAQCRIEKTDPCFDYMRDFELTPHIAGGEVRKGEKKWANIRGVWVLTRAKNPRRWLPKRLLQNKCIYTWWLPIAFCALWVAALVVTLNLD